MGRNSHVNLRIGSLTFEYQYYMNGLDLSVFAALFKEAYQKCFGHPLGETVSETESKIFCNQVEEQTGLAIGWKSIKNYSIFIINGDTAKPENPSVATLDTLARYVLKAPYSTEIQRKNNESHYPYWFLYRKQFQSLPKSLATQKRRLLPVFLIAGLATVLIAALFIYPHYHSAQFNDNFFDVSDKAMAEKGWFVKSKNVDYWNKRSDKQGELSLFTLNGDNWPSPVSKPIIPNLLLRKINSDCFTTEIHLNNFIPQQEWQQAGLLLLEDTTFTGKSIRLSVAYNDYFGGYNRPHEILVQAITSLGREFGKPEEIAHSPIILLNDSTRKNPVLLKNLQNSALRIEKHGKNFRFLYAGGAIENGAFKLIASQDFDIQPRFIGIFAICGFVKGAGIIPARFTYFALSPQDCDK